MQSTLSCKEKRQRVRVVQASSPVPGSLKSPALDSVSSKSSPPQAPREGHVVDLEESDGNTTASRKVSD